MKTYALSHLADQTLARDLSSVVARDRTTTADLLAHVAEFDERQLYLPAAYPSMYAYCVGELRMSEDVAFKRIRAARTARQFPAIFPALADGRLNLSSVLLLTPYLTLDTAEVLLAAAEHQPNTGIERLLAERFPRPDVATTLMALPSAAPTGHPGPEPGAGAAVQLAARPVGTETLVPRARLEPLAPERFALQVTIGQETHDRLRYAQALLGHAVPAWDVAAVLDRALVELIGRLERGKFAASARSAGRRPHLSPAGRHVPAHVRRAVWERDGGQCTFVSETGHRCPARTRLEFDHIEAFARGGEATVSGIRLRCRAHNQYGAECTFGAEFMRHKRLAAAEARTAAKARATAADRAQTGSGSIATQRATAAVHAAAAAGVAVIERAVAAEQAAAAEQSAAPKQAAAAQLARELDVVPWLRRLGFSASEARSAAALCEGMPDASLEQRVRVALSFFRVRGARVVRAAS